MNPDSFCSWCSKAFPTFDELYAHLHAHRFPDNGEVPPPSRPQIFNRLPSVERDEVNRPSLDLTLSIGRTKLNDHHDTGGLTMEQREHRNSHFPPLLKPTNKGKELLYVEAVADNFETMDLLREWTPIRGLEWDGYDSWSSSSSPISNASTGGEKLNLDLKLG